MKNGKWIVLLGVPGCGKGTQCELLKNSNLDFKVICVGDVLRSNNSMLIPQLGKTVSEILGRGILLPDEAIIDLVKSELSKMSNVKNHNLIFDGFPRTIGQAEALTKVASDFNQKISYALSFDIPDDLLYTMTIFFFLFKKEFVIFVVVLSLIDAKMIMKIHCL